MNRRSGWIVSLFILALALAGCSGTPADNRPTERTPSASDANVQESGNTAGASTPDIGAAQATPWPRTIKDAAGHETVLKTRPERVAVLHPLYLDYFFALDAPPIASSSAASAMKEFATLQPYTGTAEMIDLGNGRELNLEKIMEASPDVIVTFKGHVDAIYDELNKIAPVIQVDYGDTWENTMMLCAQIIGKEELAEQYIKETREMIRQAKERMGNLKDKSFALFRVNGNDFYAQGTKNTVYYNETEGFGLQVPKGYPEDGAAISLEALAVMNPDYIIFQHDLETAQAAVREKESLAVWNSLEAVENNHVLFFDNSLNSGSVLAIRLAAEHFMSLAGQ